MHGRRELRQQSGLSKSRCKGIREENPNLFQEGPIWLGMSCEEWGEWRTSGSDGPAQTKPHDFGKPPGFYSKGNGKPTLKWTRTGRYGERRERTKAPT